MKRTLTEGLALLRRALSHPASPILLALLLAIPVATGFLLTPTPAEATLPTEEAELHRMATELSQLETKEALTEEEQIRASLYRLALEEQTALTAPYLFDAACDLITESDPTRAETLRRVLREKDLDLYLSLIRSALEQNPALSPEEAERDYEETRLRLILTADGQDLTPGESYALRLVRLVRLSLAERRDLCRPYREGSPLTERETARFTALAEALSTLLEKERVAPVPANAETLAFGEGCAITLLFFLLLIACAKNTDAAPAVRLVSLLLFTIAYLLLSALTLTVVLAIVSPESLAPYLTSLGALPFSPALLLRLVLDALPPLTLALAADGLARRTGRRLIFPALALLLFVAGAAFSALLPLLAEESSTLYLLLPDLSHALLPAFPEASPASPLPLFTLALYLALFALSLALFLKRETIPAMEE
ncbi:MAG: hypothetical protein IJC84_03880 [Clostridia bacterium]|nr:hypothetical protein [Clostridia bacterium]